MLNTPVTLEAHCVILKIGSETFNKLNHQFDLIPSNFPNSNGLKTIKDGVK